MNIVQNTINSGNSLFFYLQTNNLSGYPKRLHALGRAYGLDVEDAIQNREEAFRKYLGLEKETDNLYIPNGDGTFKYNDKRLTEEAKDNFVGQSQERAADFLTSNSTISCPLL